MELTPEYSPEEFVVSTLDALRGEIRKLHDILDQLTEYIGQVYEDLHDLGKMAHSNTSIDHESIAKSIRSVTPFLYPSLDHSESTQDGA